jgi:hypothetical protein
VLLAGRPQARISIQIDRQDSNCLATKPGKASKSRTAGPTVSQHNTSVYRLVVGLVWFLELAD